MIADTEIKGASHSCECGKSNRLMKKIFDAVSIEKLFAYGASRIEDKRKML